MLALTAAERLSSSQALHASVRAFARQYAGPSAEPHSAQLSDPAERSSDAAEPLSDALKVNGDFEKLALEIAAFQVRSNAHYARRVGALGSAAFAAGIASIPPVPADAFRYAPVFSFPQGDSETCFSSSGTTAANTGRHWLRTTQTYTELLLAGARRVFPRPPGRAPKIIALAPYNANTPSSLGYMMQCFMREFDGRGLFGLPQASAFELNENGRWLATSAGVDATLLKQVCEQSQAENSPLWILATSFALVQLFDAFPNQHYELPAGSVVMQTGGFKGRTREVSRHEVLGQIEKHFSPSEVINEYGMTELASQLYERIPLGPGVPQSQRSNGPACYQTPPWLRVIPRDPATLQPVPDGQPGLANFIDLGNVDSAVSVLTQDLVVKSPEGVYLLGRNPGATLRGCSLSVEQLFERGTHAQPR